MEGMAGGGGAPGGAPERYVFDNFAIGIDRTRLASPPRDGALYDLVNAYLSPGHTIKRRPGFKLSRALAGCYGMCSYGGTIHTFFSGADPGSGGGVTTHKVVCPDGSGSALAKIHMAKPLYGFLYVVAEFANGSVFHLYLDDGSDQCPKWAANTQYQYGSTVAPKAAPNGMHFQCTSTPAYQNWYANGMRVAVGTHCQPSKPNGLAYQCTAVGQGAVAWTGGVEPRWPTVVGNTVTEYPADGAVGKWKAGMAVTTGEICEPTALNESGKMLVAKANPSTGKNVNHTGSNEPAWDTYAIGTTINDGDVIWKVVASDFITWTCVSFNVSGGAEPAWPATPGLTVNDGTATWTAIGMDIKDQGCPQTKQAIILAGCVWALDVHGHNVKKSAAANPRAWQDVNGQWQADNGYHPAYQAVTVVDPNGYAQKLIKGGISASTAPQWSPIIGTITSENTGTVQWLNIGIAAPQDAGSLPFSLDAGEDTSGTALGSYQGDLVIHSASGFELWQVDPDPSQCVLLQGFEGRGSIFTRGTASTGTDALYLTTFGVRSLSQVLASSSLAAGDAGVAVDALVAPTVSSADTFTPLAFYVAALGQLWMCNGNTIYAYTNMADLQIQGWSRYTLPWSVQYVASRNGVVYVLASDSNVYTFDTQAAYYQDDNGGAQVVFNTSIIWPYMVLGRHTMFQPEATAAYAKFIAGVNVIASAACQFQGGYDESNLANLTAVMNVGPDDRPLGLNPVEVTCMSFSPQISYAGNTAFEFSSMIVWYKVLAQAVG